MLCVALARFILALLRGTMCTETFTTFTGWNYSEMITILCASCIVQASAETLL